jgi:hypothetical protein
MTNNNDKAIGFTPQEICPHCGNLHEVKYLYKGMPILACEMAPRDQILSFLAEDAERLGELFEATKKIG